MLAAKARGNRVNWILALPLELRMAIMAVVGVLVGTQVNRGVYRLAWNPRDIGPWSLPHVDAPGRSIFDRLPVLGWGLLRRESSIHGPGFWIRPLLVELAMGAGFAALYWHEIDQRAAVPLDQNVFVAPGLITPLVVHLQLLSHLVLISLMMVATLIDFDEQTIPDAITIPGTLLGLTIAVLSPQSRAIVTVPAAISGFGYSAEFLHLASGTGRPGGSDWPAWLNGVGGLMMGLGCFVAWCVAIIPWTWTLRRGFVKAVQFWFASIPRRPATVPISIMGVIGASVIGTVWFLYAGGPRWESFLSALVGLAVGGAIIWSVRIVGSAALQQEAMGFGDVTLMAMIGSFTGWQPTLIIFFMAPFSAVLIAVAQFAVSRRHDIAFGPYLCLATLFWLLWSGSIWRNYGLPIFSLGWFVPAVGLSGLLLMGGMLQVWRLVRDALFPWTPEEDTGLPGQPDTSQFAGSSSENAPPFASRPARCEHPLRKTISLQRSDPLLPGSRQLGHRPPGSQLFRR
jgi:prepilin signal peptidase PulO-like enzyme (type II secretory pathway)